VIHLAWLPSSSEPREVFALWGQGAELSSGGDLGFSYLCEASHIGSGARCRKCGYPGKL
jgi:hypothetical protein